MFSSKWPKNPTFFSQQLKIMNRKNSKQSNKKQIFINNVQMETQTVYTANGNINIYPCSFELGQHIVVSGNRVSQKGRMITDDSGTSHFTPYAVDSGSRYDELYATTNGELKRTKKNVIVKVSLPIAIGPMAIVEALREQILEIVNFILVNPKDFEK